MKESGDIDSFDRGTTENRLRLLAIGLLTLALEVKVDRALDIFRAERHSGWIVVQKRVSCAQIGVHPGCATIQWEPRTHGCVHATKCPPGGTLPLDGTV